MFYKDIDFSKFSSIKIGQIERVLMLERGDIIPNDRFIVGGANNLLISENPPLLMKLSKDFDFIEISNGGLVVGASTPTGKLLSFAKRYNIGGVEFISKLPGTVGGMVAMNAGVKSFEIFNIIKRVKVNNIWIDRDNIEYGYRFANLDGVVSDIELEMRDGFDYSLLNSLSTLRNNQPKSPSAGSIFKNPKGDYAGRLIDKVGLKGYRKGGVEWSRVHANFLVNISKGTFNDAIYLIDLAKRRVNEEFGINLVEEVVIL